MLQLRRIVIEVLGGTPRRLKPGEWGISPGVDDKVEVYQWRGTTISEFEIVPVKVTVYERSTARPRLPFVSPGYVGGGVCDGVLDVLPLVLMPCSISSRYP